jgi:hypothetical protein
VRAPALFASLIVSLAACASGSEQDPANGSASPYSKSWIQEQIASFETGTARGRSAVAGKYFAQGTALYLIRSPCCDRFDYLYTVEGRVFCAPSGGLAGHGDGKCPAGLATASPVSRARTE